MKDKVNDIISNVSFVGTCLCDGDLISYLGSKPSNKFNVYCMSCGSISDIRKPKSGDTFNTQEGETPLGMLCRLYQDAKGIYITDSQIQDCPISTEVNNLHGAV